MFKLQIQTETGQVSHVIYTVNEIKTCLFAQKPIAVLITLKHLIVAGVKYIQVVILERRERLYKVTLKIPHMHHGNVTGQFSWITGTVQKSVPTGQTHSRLCTDEN